VGLFTPGRCQIGYTCHQNSTYGLHSLPGGVRLVTRATRTRLMGCTHSTPGGCQIGYMCDQNSTYGLHSLPGGGRLVSYMEYTGLSSIEPCFDAQ
jgi:hypothetical protein